MNSAIEVHTEVLCLQPDLPQVGHGTTIPAMLQPNGIAHVGLRVADLTRVSNFYERQVGLQALEKHEGCHIFSIGGGALLEIWSGGSASTTKKTPAQQSSSFSFAVDRLEPAMAALLQQGVQPCGEIGDYLGTRWVHYLDPEGNQFGVVDRNGTR
ncbi:VOC family protein [Roseateles sp. SL47]|uniref:VOC family protein n=1 Tax=Roseateles sp. SL47 TaxID=2995138 RepID=UPI0022701ED6|nr:VOC family protein [Roseateles sp. SL47]WAC74045.1 VOC family protein [Roseateles sp. SL47]